MWGLGIVLDPCYKPEVDEVSMAFFAFPPFIPASFIRGLIGLLSTQGLTHKPQQHCVFSTAEFIAQKTIVLDDLISELWT